jgi:hypothetical protein
MKTATTILIAALAVAGSVGTANATDWIILDQQHTTCVPASTLSMPELRSPAAAEAYLRSGLYFKETRVDRAANGKIVMVGVIRLDGMVHVFFRTWQPASTCGPST